MGGERIQDSAIVMQEDYLRQYGSRTDTGSRLWQLTGYADKHEGPFKGTSRFLASVALRMAVPSAEIRKHGEESHGWHMINLNISQIVLF